MSLEELNSRKSYLDKKVEREIRFAIALIFATGFGLGFVLGLCASYPVYGATTTHDSHHPEHYADGIRGFDLLDLVEMFCDWKAASMRHDDGDIHRSIDINAERFEMGDVLRSILHNTATRMGWDRKEGAGE